MFGNESLDCLDEHESGKLKSSDVGRMFITVNANGRKSPNNPQNAVVRFQLMELLIRCAIEKFLVAGLVQTELEAV